MKRVTTTFCLAAVMACGMAAAAQNTQTGQKDQSQQPTSGTQATTPQPGGGTQTQATSPQARETSTVSFIGCVESSGPNAFSLTVSEQPGMTASTGTGAGVSGNVRSGDTEVGVTGQAQANSGRTAQATSGMTATVGQRVQLIGSGRTNISPHVGHKVEVTGTMVPQGAAQGRATGQPAAEMRLNVSNLKMISATCDTTTPSPTSSPQRTQPRNQGSGSTTQPGSTPGAAGTSGTSSSEPAPAGTTGSEPTMQTQPEQSPQRQ